MEGVIGSKFACEFRYNETTVSTVEPMSDTFCVAVFKDSTFVNPVPYSIAPWLLHNYDEKYKQGLL